MKKKYLIYFLLLFSNYCDAQFYCDTSYFPNSKKIRCVGFYDKNEKCWIQKGFFYDGRVSQIEKYSTPNFNNRNFQVIGYHETGIEAIKYQFKNERLENVYEENYFNGNKKLKGLFITDLKMENGRHIIKPEVLSLYLTFNYQKKTLALIQILLFKTLILFQLNIFKLNGGK